MKLHRSLIAIMLAMTLGVATPLVRTTPAVGAQNSTVMPTTGPMSLGTFVATYLNPGLQALLSGNSGSTPPANGPSGAALTYQFWWDTSTSPRVLRVNDGINWVQIGSLDTTSHAFSIATSQASSTDAGASTSILDANRGGALLFTNSSAAVSIAQAGSGGNFLGGWYADVKNAGSGTVTLTSSVSTIDGAATKVLNPGQSIRVISNGANYATLAGPGTPTSTVAGITFAKSAVASQWLRSLGTDGVLTASQPAFTDISGTALLAQGGTSANLTASNGGIFYSTGSAGAILSGTATARQMLQSGALGAPAWSTATWPATTTINQLLYSSAANVVGAVSTANGGILNANASGVPGMTVTPVLGVPGTSTGTMGFAGLSSGTATIAAQAAAGTPTLTLPTASGTFAVNASLPIVLSATTGALTCPTCATSTLNAAALTKADDTNVTLTLGGSPTSALLNATSVTVGWTGTLAAARLNANVVQGITNDTNINGSITAQNLTLAWTGTLANARLATMATNTIKGNATSGTASPTDLAMPTCSTSASAVTWTTNIGFGCNTAVAAPAGGLTGTTLAANIVSSSLTGVGTLTGGGTGAGFTVSLTTSTITGALPCANTPALTGDATTSAGSCATTLASVASGATTGGSTAIPVVTFNNKGLVTAVTTAAVVAPAGTLSGTTLNAAVVSSSLSTLGTIGTGVWQGTSVALGFGGTGQATALAARGSSGLNIESCTSTGNANYTVVASDRCIYHTALSAPRTDTLPAANSVNAGGSIVIADFAGVATVTNTITATRAGADTINGSTSSVVVNAAYGIAVLISDGTSRWTTLLPGAGGGGSGTVTSLTPGNGLCGSGATCGTSITVSGTINARFARQFMLPL
jgi:hypothetical protein